MLKIIVIVGLLLLGYWYYTGPYQSRQSSPAQQAQDHARQMHRCMQEEARMTAGAGLAGMVSESGDVQALCADKLDLELSDGQWVPRGR